MKERRIYYRRKGKSLVIEGKEDGKSILIWTLPEALDLLNGIMVKASFFTQEKEAKIKEKIERLDIREEREGKVNPKVRTITITRTPEKDATEPRKATQEEIKQLWEITK